MKKLSIPEQITLDRMYLPRLGLRELKQGVLLMLPGVVCMIVLLCIFEEPGQKLLTMVGGFCWAGCCYAVVARIEGVGSMYAYITRIIRYHRTQQKFYYKHEKEVLRYVGEEKQP